MGRATGLLTLLAASFATPLAVAQGAAPSSTASLPPAPPPPTPTATTSAPPPPAQPTTTAPPPQPPPPPGYPTATPPPGPPPPGYYYPRYPPGYPPMYPPPGYPPGYVPPGYYGPNELPAASKPDYPDDSAGQTSPFIDLLTGGVVLDHRFESLLAVGFQGGGYVATRVRLAAHVLMFTSEPRDDGQYDYAYSGTFVAQTSKRPTILYGASVGVAPLVGKTFIFAPGLAFHRSDVGDYGTFLGLSLPFEWVTTDGARFGFVVDIGRAFGGSYTERCYPGASSCAGGTERTTDRPSGTGFFSAFQFGWGFNHPKRKQPD